MSASGEFILGINAWDHDVSACLLRDGEVVAAIAKERLTRVKHDAGFHDVAVDHCLAAAGIPLDRVDLVVRNCYMLPVPDLERRLRSEDRPYHLPLHERLRAVRHPLFGAPDGSRIRTVSHHLAHAYSAFAASPFEEGAVMVVDGVGSHRADVTEAIPPGDDAPPAAREAESYYVFRGATLTPVRKVWMVPSRGFMNEEFQNMDGIGARYSAVSTYIFGHWNRCGEVMGLAPYGRTGMPPLLRMRDGDLLEIPPWPENLVHPFVGRTDEEWNASLYREEWEDLARRMQEDAEEVLLARARRLHAMTGMENLCLAGGVALNCVANGRIVEETPFRRVFIQPAAGDDGIALGAAWWGRTAVRGGKRPAEQRHSFFGRTADEGAVERATGSLLRRVSASARAVSDVASAAADLLAAGKVIGWVQGGSEFGPRALGHRSILADPRSAAMRDHVNALVKKRQGFRPFAPAVPAEHAEEFFEGTAESPFMLLAKRVRPEAKGRIPAVVHVDGTARVQTVRREDDPLFHALLLAFGARTGVPVLLNTSFNLRGEPIVETPEDAVECFLRSRLDALVVHDRVLEKRFVHGLLSHVIGPLARRFRPDGP